jgi:hypothetical protein
MSIQITEIKNLSTQTSKEIEPETTTHFKTEKKGKWSEKEDEQLTKLVKIYNYKNWKSISQHIPGRSAIQCLHRWTKILQPGLVKGPWTAQEDAKLFDWVKRQGPTKWTLCSEIIPGRSGKQCREHWNNSLNPEVKKGSWTSEEDFLIMYFYKKYNGSWKKIIPIFNKRTENSIKNRFFSQLRKIATIKIQSKEKKFSARIKLDTLLNYLDLATLKAKEKFLKEKLMSENELEKYIENINKKIIKNLPKNKINLLESKDFKEYNIDNLDINENNNNFQDFNLDNNNNNLKTDENNLINQNIKLNPLIKNLDSNINNMNNNKNNNIPKLKLKSIKNIFNNYNNINNNNNNIQNNFNYEIDEKELSKIQNEIYEKCQSEAFNNLLKHNNLLFENYNNLNISKNILNNNNNNEDNIDETILENFDVINNNINMNIMNNNLLYRNFFFDSNNFNQKILEYEGNNNIINNIYNPIINNNNITNIYFNNNNKNNNNKNKNINQNINNNQNNIQNNQNYNQNNNNNNQNNNNINQNNNNINQNNNNYSNFIFPEIKNYNKLWLCLNELEKKAINRKNLYNKNSNT